LLFAFDAFACAIGLTVVAREEVPPVAPPPAPEAAVLRGVGDDK
jgi:hypothetical protein